MFHNRLLSSSTAGVIMAALSITLAFTAVAAADTLALNGSALHFGISTPNYVGTHSAGFPAGEVTSVPAISISKVRTGNANFGGTHSTISYRAKNWNGGSQKAPMSTPEPGSLMLLSTGLVGIAGMVRRKLQGPLTVSA
jgi:hypothetical protein